MKQEAEEKETIAGYVSAQLADAVGQYADRNGISRSKAVGQLVEQGLVGRRWGQKINESIEAVSDPDTVAFHTVAVDSNGEYHLTTAARDPGYTGDNQELNNLADNGDPHEVVLMLAELAVVRQRAMRSDKPLGEMGTFYQGLDKMSNDAVFHEEK